jgi:hypothetical protein
MKTILVSLSLLAGGCGLGYCVADPGEVEASLYVSDAATGAAVRAPQFASEGVTLEATCQEPTPTDHLLCGSWVIAGPPGRKLVTVTAANYAPASVVVDTTNDATIHLAVEMTAL